jgi:methionyl-tRNA formyltransferase
MMRIVLLGAVEFSKHCLQVVLDNGANVVAVLTPSQERARFNSDYADLVPLAVAHRIPTYHISKVSDPETVDLIRSLEPDVIFVFGFSQLVSKEILDIPRLGCIGTHPALLPRNRGRHPLIWALVEGLSESGLTFFYLDEGAGSGDILWQKPFSITLEDDARSLYDKIKALATIGIREFLPQLETGTAPRIPQDHSQATYWRKRTEEDGEIRWNASTMQTYNLVRALGRPYVGAHTHLNGKKLLIWRCSRPTDSLPSREGAFPPGTIFDHTGGVEFKVRTGDGYLKVVEYESEGIDIPHTGLRLGK